MGKLNTNIKTRLFITGANGFIGGHLTAKLSKYRFFEITGLIHKNKIIKNNNVKYIYGNILDKNQISNLTKNTDIIIHCAYGNSMNTSLNSRITIEGSKNIVQAVIKNDIKKLIYISSAGLYNTRYIKVCTENNDYTRSPTDLYTRDKKEAESAVWKMVENRQIVATIIQPTIVYGPNSKTWAKDLFYRIRNAEFYIPSNAKGLANFVYIDDVVQAVRLTINNTKESDNEKFIISGKSPIYWKHIYKSFRLMLNDINYPDKKDQFSFNENLKVMKRKIKANIFSYIPFINYNFHNNCIYSNKKAETFLGYIPKIDFETGLQQTGQWMKKNI